MAQYNQSTDVIDILNELFLPETNSEQSVNQPTVMSQYSQGSADSAYLSIGPLVNIQIENQPMKSHRVRSKGEMADFASRGSAKATGSRLKGSRGTNDFVTISLTLNGSKETVSGELIVMLIGCHGGLDIQSKPVKIHPYSLCGDFCDNGLYRKTVLVGSQQSTTVMLNKQGIVQCKKKDLTSTVDEKAKLLLELFKDEKSRGLFYQRDDMFSGPLCIDPLNTADSNLRILFAYLPASSVINAFALSDPISCCAGNSGGKDFKVKAFNPVSVVLNVEQNPPISSDVWLQLEADVKVKSERVTAELVLPVAPILVADPASPKTVRVVIDDLEVERNLVKLGLTQLKCEQLELQNINNSDFMADLCLSRTSNPIAGEAAAQTVTSTVALRVVFAETHTASMDKRRKVASNMPSY